MHPSQEAILKFFQYEHLSGFPRQVSEEFYFLANKLVVNFALDGPELTVALRKLLEAKDCAVRAAL